MTDIYRPHYHATVPNGWSNDPNGTIYYNKKAHLFYQHYPHKPEWGTMHWGHFVTDDFVHWDNLPIALVPDQDYEEICGCCSGSAVEMDGRLYLMYTAAQPERQRQCLAFSDDGGVHFQKEKENPILTAEMLDEEVSTMDFRDPRLFKKDGYYYFLAGVRIVDPAKASDRKPSAIPSGAPFRSPSAGPLPPSETPLRPPSAGRLFPSIGPMRSPSQGSLYPADPEKDGCGNLILCRSRDLYHWEYLGYLLHPQPEFRKEFYELNGVYECPDYFEINGNEVVLSSPQNLPQMGNLFQNIHSGLYMLGKMNFENGQFHVDKIGEVDSGFDFYAAQTLRMPDGRVIMIGWKEMWDRNYPTREEGWAGSYSLPCELDVADGELLRNPVRELEQFRGECISHEELILENNSAKIPGIQGNVLEMKLVLEPGNASKSGIALFAGAEHETLLYYDRTEQALILDRSRSGIPFTGRDQDVNIRKLNLEDPGQIELRIFLDVCSVEVFINGGRHMMTANVYPDPADRGIRFFAKGGAAAFKVIEKYELNV